MLEALMCWSPAGEKSEMEGGGGGGPAMLALLASMVVMGYASQSRASLVGSEIDLACFFCGTVVVALPRECA